MKQSASSGFAEMARHEPTVSNKPKKVTYEGKSTFIKLCFGCWLCTPHYMDGGNAVCLICGHKSKDEG
jgi:hypothetical protein